MSDIADFLRARYAEVRARVHATVRVIPSPFDGHDVVWTSDSEGERFLVDGHPFPVDKYLEVATEPAPDPEVLADLDAKLALIDEAFRYQAVIDGEWGCCHSAEAISAGLCPEQQPSDSRILRLLAQPFAGHPDHKGEDWAP